MKVKRPKVIANPEQGCCAGASVFHKVIQESGSITQQGRLLAFVDPRVADIGTDEPPAEMTQHRSSIDWRQLSASVTRPGRVAEIVDPEVAHIGNKPHQRP